MVAKRLVEIDDADLLAAQHALGMTGAVPVTIKDAVAAGLREIAAVEARRREIARLTAGSLAPMANRAVRDEAWR